MATGGTWKVKVSQIECASPSRANPDCDQWITGISGQVSSFNWPNVQLKAKDYTYCIRREVGMYTANVYRDLRGLCREIRVQGFQKGLHPSIRNRAVCSKQPFLLGTLAQLSRTVWQAARTPGANCAAVQTSVPRRKARLDYTGPIDLLWFTCMSAFSMNSEGVPFMDFVGKL